MANTPKEIIFEEEAKNKLRCGIKKLADAAAVSLGPNGLNVGLGTAFGSPTITNDGHTIIKSIELKDQFENMGAQIAKEVAEKIKEKAGDGTTTGIILFNELVALGLKNIASGANPCSIKRGLEKGLEAMLSAINDMAAPIDVADTQNIATASASGNSAIGSFISEGFAKVGKEGVITIEASKTTETSLKTVEGLQLQSGYLSGYFCTNVEKMIIEMQNPLILITDKKITVIQDLLPILQHIASTGRELLIIAEDIENEALSTLVINRLKGILKVAAIKAPGFGDNRKAMLQDIACVTGATLISEEVGLSLKEATSEALGSAEKIIVSKDKTTILNGNANQEMLSSRIKELSDAIAHSAPGYDLNKLKERKAKLQGGVAVIYVGAPTESEMKQIKQEFEDSLNATRAALEEGIVPGGGMALICAAKTLQNLTLPEDEMIGIMILEKAVSAPARQIIANSGKDSAVVMDEIGRSKASFGFNALTECVEDLRKAGIFDPAKVVKTALLHAISGAGIVLLSEALIGITKDE